MIEGGGSDISKRKTHPADTVSLQPTYIPIVCDTHHLHLLRNTMVVSIFIVAVTLATLIFSLLAALFAFRSFKRPFALPAEQASQLRGQIEQAIRTETDRLRAESQEQARALRLEVAENIRSFQASVFEAFRALSEPLQEQMRSVVAALETRLTELIQTSETHSHALRGDLTGGLQTIRTVVSETLQQMSQQQRERLEALDGKVHSLIEQQGKAQESLRQSVEARLDLLRNDNVAKLEEMRRTVDEKLQSTLETRLTESFRLVSQQLESVHRGLGEMQSLAVGVGDLKKVLSNVKIRGTWGEIQLGNLLEQFLSPDQYIRNAQIREDSQERVEYAIRMPGRGDESECLMPIDAKFPQEDYARLVAAADRGDSTAVEEAALALEGRVKSFAKTIREKYIHSPRTTEFAILFLPTESLYAEMLRRPGLFEALQRDSHVLLAGPTTLAAMLNAFQMGFRSLAIEKRSAEVWQVLGAVRSEFLKHGDVVDSLRKQLGTAVNTIERLGTRTRQMNRALKDVEAVPEAQATALLTLNTTEAISEEHTEDDLATAAD
jgi:DNA recombination protein RmuC